MSKTIKSNNYIYFYGHNSNSVYCVFSQWYQAQFTEHISSDIAITYSNCEQYMMAHKALIFGDDDIFDKIMATNDPFTIKKLGRKIKNLIKIFGTIINIKSS